MNKLMLASVTVLMAGATAMSAFAQDSGRSAGGERSWQGAEGKGPTREEARGEDQEQRREHRDERPDGGADHRGGGDDAGRGDRGRDDGNRDYGNRDYGDRDRGDRDGNRERGERNPGSSGSYAGWQTQHRDYDRDRGGNDRGDYRQGNRGDDRHGWNNDRHDWNPGHRRDSRYYTRYRDSRWSGYNWYPQYRYRASTRYMYPSGYRPYRWQVGYRMPYNYYNSHQYYVDYRAYRLPPPPYGYSWVRVDRDVVLVSLASGLIRDVLYGLFY